MTFLTVLGQMFLKFMAATDRIFLFSFNGLSHCVRPLGATMLFNHACRLGVDLSPITTLSTFANIYIDGQKSVLAAA